MYNEKSTRELVLLLYASISNVFSNAIMSGCNILVGMEKKKNITINCYYDILIWFDAITSTQLKDDIHDILLVP